MTVRCIACNKVNSFRNYRGNKLSEKRCECGGSLQMVGGCHALSGTHPFDFSKTYTDERFIEGEYFYADRNKKGEYFIIHDGYYHQILNPVLAPRKSDNNIKATA